MLVTSLKKTHKVAVAVEGSESDNVVYKHSQKESIASVQWDIFWNTALFVLLPKI